jgi:hypothetical protein
LAEIGRGIFIADRKTYTQATIITEEGLLGQINLSRNEKCAIKTENYSN